VFAACPGVAGIFCSMTVAYHLEMRKWERMQKVIRILLFYCI